MMLVVMAIEDLLLAEEETEREDCMTVEDVVPMRVNIWGDEEEDGLKAQVSMTSIGSCVVIVSFSLAVCRLCSVWCGQEGGWAWLTMCLTPPTSTSCTT